MEHPLREPPRHSGGTPKDRKPATAWSCGEPRLHSRKSIRQERGNQLEAHSSNKRMMAVLEGRLVTQETVRKVSFRQELNLMVKEKDAPGIVPRF